MHSPIIRDRHLGLLLRRGLSLGSLLLVAVDHDNAYESAHHGRTQEGQDNGDADSPNTRREQVVERVARINEGLQIKLDFLIFPI